MKTILFRHVLWSGCLLWLLAGGGLGSERPHPTVVAVRALLEAQVTAWNRGDLEGFMEGYWRSPELTFVSGTTVTKGWEATLTRYRQRYQSEGRAMGTLRFDDLVIEPVGPRAALIRGAWRVTLPDQVMAGRFTLLARRFPAGWRIVYDHTS
ncbi:MAG: nuclear transport factor 2 family protein [Chloracidobacterium sp.]|uniref:Nuclear transport factor 2 family protein n=1 Tax=Chloracidobacterium validum TaxID=2821543 RepID=A0ABX8B857_9BACT|nr:nuclear transport factor 2 family protein [Chloracidobacterium validum]QUW03132.1 nuclear transport factor 2 family protein [Chloracidobacterium validum]